MGENRKALVPDDHRLLCLTVTTRNELSHNCREEGAYLCGQSGPHHLQYRLWSHTGSHLHRLLFQNLKKKEIQLLSSL